MYFIRFWRNLTKKDSVESSVADPDPKDPHHFAGSIIFSMDPDPDPDQNLAHFHHLSTPSSHLTH